MEPRSRFWHHICAFLGVNSPVIPRHLIWISLALTLGGALLAVLFFQPGWLLFAAVGLYLRFALMPDSEDRRIDLERYQAQQTRAEFDLSTWEDKSTAGPEEPWIENRIRPMPLPYGVADDGAERLVADWMKYLGVLDASATPYTRDGGRDVVSHKFVVSVKNYKKQPVTVQEVREIFGVAASDKKLALLFTSSYVSQDGLDFADKNNIPLIQYDAISSSLEELNHSGFKLLEQGLYED